MRVTPAAILLVYCTLLLPPLCFCINCPLERVALDLSHPPPPTLTLPACGVGGGGVVAHPPDPNPPPPPNTDGQRSEVRGWGMRTVGGSLTSYISPPTQFSSPIHGLLTTDRQSLGGRRIRVRGMGYHPPPPTPQAGCVTDSDGGGCERTVYTETQRG